MNDYVEQFDESDNDSDCLIIDEEEKRPKLGTLIIRKGPNGSYIVEKGKQNDNKSLAANKLIKPSNQTMFYMVPVFKSQPLNVEEISEIYKKCIGENVPFEEIQVSTFKTYNSLTQDSIVDSTSKQNLQHCETKLWENDSEEDSNLHDFHDSDRSQLSNASSADSQKLFSLPKKRSQCNDSVESGISSQHSLDPIILPPSYDEECCIKKDCFLVENPSNLSEVKDLLRRDSTVEKKIKYSDMQLEEPVLERLFSNISNVSTCSNNSTTCSISNEGIDFSEVDENKFESAKNLIDDDGNMLVINRNNSNVIVVGYD